MLMGLFISNVEMLHGDCLEKLKGIPSGSVDAIVTDPPYELGFMGKSWDNTGIANNPKMWAECLRVLKPGGHVLAFSGTRTYHRMACAIEDAGFEVRDMIEWVYGSGFPKSLNIGKAVDKLQGNEREKTGEKEYKPGWHKEHTQNDDSWTGAEDKGLTITKGTSEYEGWGTALKPSHEPICMARKPLKIMILDKTKKVYEDELPEMTDNEYTDWFKESWVDVVRMGYGVKWVSCSVAENCLKWGTGGINIDESRVSNVGYTGGGKNKGVAFGITGDGTIKHERCDGSLGRFPANLIHDNSEEVRECFPETGKSTGGRIGCKDTGETSVFTSKNSGLVGKYEAGDPGYGDSGNASRFFKSIIYQSKAPKNQRYSYLTCNCQTVKLESWLKQDQNLNEKMETTSPEVDIYEDPTKDDSDLNITLFGNEQTVQSLKDTTSTTLTEIRPTTDSLISNSSIQQNINESTEGVKLETENGGSLAESVKNSNQLPQNTGISQKKDGLCMGVAVPATLAESYRKSVCSNCGGEVKSSGHPTQKPIALMEYLVNMVTRKGQIVLDPFMGSGTTGVACKKLGRTFIGIEREEDYIAIARCRIEAQEELL